VTKAAAAFSPPQSYRKAEAWGDSHDWYGTSKLWTSLPPNGHWRTMQRWMPKAVFREKLFWWREGYDPYSEPRPNLMVTAERLDGGRQDFDVGHATNAIRADSPDSLAMLVLIDVPIVGYWKITGAYADAVLSYIVWVGP
jgi:hypothetical protein